DKAREYTGATALAWKRPKGPGPGAARTCVWRPSMASVGEAVLMQLLAQRRAIDAERGRAPLLSAAVPREHLGEQRRFDLVQHERIEAFAWLRFDIGKIAAHGARNAF